MNKSKPKTNIPLIIAANISNKNKYNGNIWITLPVTKEYFFGAAGVVCDKWEDIKIGDYHTTIPNLSTFTLMKSRFSEVNHLAARLKKLTDEQALKLAALSQGVYDFRTVEQLIDYTYNTEKYDLIPRIITHWELGQHRVKELNQMGLPPAVIRCIDAEAYGRNASYYENGEFTPFGYVCSKEGWDKPAKKRRVPECWNIQGENGEDLYGAWYYDNDEDESEAFDIEEYEPLEFDDKI